MSAGQAAFDFGGVVTPFESLAPVGFSHERVAERIEYVAVVECHFGRRVAVERQCLLHVLLRLVVASETVEDPCQRVEERRVVLRNRRRARSHRQRAVEIATLDA